MDVFEDQLKTGFVEQGPEDVIDTIIYHKFRWYNFSVFRGMIGQ
jgi:hypothetical protein